MTVGQWRAVGRAAIGIGAVTVGALRQLDQPIYPVNDYRNDPATWAAINGIVILAGIGLILSAVIPFIRGSRSN